MSFWPLNPIGKTSVSLASRLIFEEGESTLRTMLCHVSITLDKYLNLFFLFFIVIYLLIFIYFYFLDSVW